MTAAEKIGSPLDGKVTLSGTRPTGLSLGELADWLLHLRDRDWNEETQGVTIMREKHQRARCQVCGGAFDVHRSDARFCSAACRQLAWRVAHGRSMVLRLFKARLEKPGRN